MTLPIVVTILIGLGLAVVVAAGASDRRQARRRVTSAATELLDGAPPPSQPQPRTLIAIVALGTLFGALGSGYAIAGRSDSAAANRAGQASANFNRCQADVATGWRKGIAVLLIGYEPAPNPAKLPPDLRTVAARLHLPRNLDGIRSEGRSRLIAALLDDARLGATVDRICPYVPGDPARTPAQPVNSATDELEQQLAKLHDAATSPSTTTTTEG